MAHGGGIRGLQTHSFPHKYGECAVAAMNALGIALDLAAQGWPVFPCNRHKMPAIPKREGGRGFHDATRDPVAIRALFSRRNAILVSVPTGEISGVDVLDLDYRHGAAEWELAHAELLPTTRTHRTQSGGKHLLFRHAPGVRNSASKIAPGVDTRGAGGYIVFPPSPGYSLTIDAAIAHWPDALLALALPPPPPPKPASPTLFGATVRQSRLDAIIASALDRVRHAPDGAKHYTLRNSALLLGGIAAQAGFTDADALSWLRAALPASAKDLDAAEDTALWGLQNGRLRPLELADDPPAPRKPDPRRRETARAAFRLLRMGVPSTELVAALHDQNCRRPDPLPADQIADAALWAARQSRGGNHAR